VVKGLSTRRTMLGFIRHSFQRQFSRPILGEYFERAFRLRRTALFRVHASQTQSAFTRPSPRRNSEKYFPFLPSSACTLLPRRVSLVFFFALIESTAQASEYSAVETSPILHLWSVSGRIASGGAFSGSHHSRSSMHSSGVNHRWCFRPRRSKSTGQTSNNANR